MDTKEVNETELIKLVNRAKNIYVRVGSLNVETTKRYVLDALGYHILTAAVVYFENSEKLFIIHLN